MQQAPPVAEPKIQMAMVIPHIQRAYQLHLTLTNRPTKCSSRCWQWQSIAIRNESRKAFANETKQRKLQISFSIGRVLVSSCMGICRQVPRPIQPYEPYIIYMCHMFTNAFTDKMCVAPVARNTNNKLTDMMIVEDDDAVIIW